MQPAWREFLDNLAALSTSDNPQALKPDTYQGARVFVRGLKPSIRGAGLTPDGNSMPMWLFDLCHIHSRDRSVLETANTFDYIYRNGINANTNVSVLANRMTLREGPQALDAQRLGRASEALRLSLIQGNPPAPGEDCAIHLFLAWPKEWDGEFRLAARGAFVVMASMKNGTIASVILESQAGAECHVYNPWSETAVDLYRDGRKSETVHGILLRFPTRIGERIALRAE